VQAETALSANNHKIDELCMAITALIDDVAGGLHASRCALA
jgi:hypothetical protein